MRAILVGVKQLNRGDATVYNVRFVDENDLTVPTVDAVTLQGYSLPVSGDDLADTDTLLEAFGKLEARVVELEAGP